MSLFDKAKEKLGEHKDKVDKGLDTASAKAKERFEGHSDKIDQGVTKAKDALHRNEGEGRPAQ